MKIYNPFYDLHIISYKIVLCLYNIIKNHMYYIKFNSNVMGILQNKTQVNSYENIESFLLFTAYFSLNFFFCSWFIAILSFFLIEKKK